MLTAAGGNLLGVISFVDGGVGTRDGSSDGELFRAQHDHET